MFLFPSRIISQRRNYLALSLILTFSILALFYDNFAIFTFDRLFGASTPENVIIFQSNFNLVRAIDRKLRLLSRNCTISPENYIHPNATAQDLSSHNATDPGTTMKTARQVERALHLSLDIATPCGGNDGLNLTLLVLICNRASDFARRQAIRQTYGGSLQGNPASALYFFIAKPEDFLTQQRILNESAHYGDLIQVDYTDSYNNLTVKSVAMIRWTALNCPLVKFLLKLDDDSFLRPRPLIRWLQKIRPNRIYGSRLQKQAPVQRTGKFALSRRYYPATRFPTYLNGVYLIPGHYTSLLYQAVLSHLPAAPFEDVYITGILAQTIGLSGEASDHISCKRCRKKSNNALKRDLRQLERVYLLFHNINSEEIAIYWNIWKRES